MVRKQIMLIRAGVLSAFLFLIAALSAAPVCADPQGIIILGDSRAEEMHMFVGDAGVGWCYKVGMGYLWMMSEGFPTIDGDVGAGTAVVITLGVNDVVDQFRIPQYAAAINAKAAEWRARGAQTFYVSITPVDDALDHYEHNSDIVYWNNTIQPLLSQDVVYLDIYSAIIGNFSTVDGLHYTGPTYERIFDLIISGVESAGYYPYSEDDYEDDGMPRTTMTVAATEGAWSGAEMPVDDAVSGISGTESEEEVPGYTGWQALADKTIYYVDGVPASGLITVDGELHFFDDDGSVMTGWIHRDGMTCVADEEGIVHTGWISDGHYWYYADESGILVKGWFRKDGKRYHADESCIIESGWVTDPNAGTFYLASDGHALSGWYEIEGKTYYFDSIGCMVTGQKAIGDGEYLFADSGELVRTVSGPAPEVLKAE